MNEKIKICFFRNLEKKRGFVEKNIFGKCFQEIVKKLKLSNFKRKENKLKVLNKKVR